MNSNIKTARIAGTLYFTFLVCGMISQIVRSNLIVADNAAKTAKNIMASEGLFRISFVSDLIGETVYIFLALFLYKLLKSVNKNHAMLMVIFVLVGIPIAMLNQLSQFASILLLSGTDYLKVFNADQLHALAMLFLDLYKHGVFIADIFWGLWLFPFGYLVFKSGFLPKIIGVLLMIGCFGFLIEFLIFSLIPDYEMITYPGLAVATIAELSTIFWLLIKGVKVEQQDNHDSASL